MTDIVAALVIYEDFSIQIHPYFLPVLCESAAAQTMRVTNENYMDVYVYRYTVCEYRNIVFCFGECVVVVGSSGSDDDNAYE